MKFKPTIKPINKFLEIFLSDNIIGITLCPFGIYVKNIYDIKTIFHEKIHWQQQLEMLVIFFYLWYVVEWLIRSLFQKNAYRNISFEREAYNSSNLNYLEDRKRFSWIKYIFKNK